MSYFVVIGWGSLLWDIDNLEPYVEGDWYMEQGPCLPLEFVRVSPKRKHALTLIIDHDHGASCGTSFIASTRGSIHDVIMDLASREVTGIENIGAIDRNGGYTQSKSLDIQTIISTWLEQMGYLGAVWTDLERNFDSQLGSAFSVDSAIAYLKGLGLESLIEAKRYIDNAPKAVATPLRQALANDPWWMSIDLDFP